MSKLLSDAKIFNLIVNANVSFFKRAVLECADGAEILDCLIEAMKMAAYDFARQYPEAEQEVHLMLKRAELLGKIYPEMQHLDKQLEALA